MVRRDIGDQHRPQQSPSSPAWSPELVPSSPPPGLKRREETESFADPIFSVWPQVENLKAFASGSAAKNAPAMQEPQETWVWPLELEDALEEGTATHSSILAWRIPWTEEPGRLQSIQLQRVRQNWGDLACTYYNLKVRKVCLLYTVFLHGSNPSVETGNPSLPQRGWHKHLSFDLWRVSRPWHFLL